MRLLEPGVSRRPHPVCGRWCRFLGLEVAHTVNRTGAEVAERIRRILAGESLT